MYDDGFTEQLDKLEFEGFSHLWKREGNGGGEKRKIGNNMAGFCVEKWAVLEYDNNIVVQWRYPGKAGLTEDENPGKTGEIRGNG